jgi:hypothetical protein
MTAQRETRAHHGHRTCGRRPVPRPKPVAARRARTAHHHQRTCFCRRAGQCSMAQQTAGQQAARRSKKTRHQHTHHIDASETQPVSTGRTPAGAGTRRCVRRS